MHFWALIFFKILLIFNFLHVLEGLVIKYKIQNFYIVLGILELQPP